MKEVLELPSPISKENIIISGNTTTPMQLLSSSLGNPPIHSREDLNRWHFSAGNPEFWKFKDRLLVPGGHVLDLGIGELSSSLFFALQGMNVTGYEISPLFIEIAEEMKKGWDLPVNIVNQDITQADLGINTYDTVIMNHTFAHFPSKMAVFDVINRAIDATKPGGHIFLRAGGKQDSSFRNFESDSLYTRYSEVTRVDEDVFKAPCYCSGEEKIDFHLFLDPIETLSFVRKKGLRLIHTQVIPEFGQYNIMYGQDYNKDQVVEVGGMITILGQKQSANI